MTEEIEFGKVNRVDFGLEDHGILGLNIDFDFGTSGQGTGWYSMQNEHAWEYIKHILNTFHVDRLEQLVGKVMRVHRAERYGQIVAIQQAPWEGSGMVAIRTWWDSRRQLEAESKTDA